MYLRLWAVAREQERQLSSGEVPMGGDVLGGLKLIVREPLLRWLAFMVLFGVGVGTLLYNEQAALVRRLYTDAAAATAYYASIDLAINALTLVLQLLVTRALLSRFGIAPALLIPGVAITLGYAVLTASPLPMMIAIAGDHALQRVRTGQAGARDLIHARRPGMALQGRRGDRHRDLPRWRSHLRVGAQAGVGIRLQRRVRRRSAGGLGHDTGRIRSAARGAQTACRARCADRQADLRLTVAGKTTLLPSGGRDCCWVLRVPLVLCRL